MPNISKIKVGEDEYILKDPTGLTSFPIATSSSFGMVKLDSQTTQIDSSGKISIKMPYATDTLIGGLRLEYRNNNLYIYNED